jgi:hypothetical protein
VEWPGGGIEHHPGHGDWIRLLHDNGFEVQELHELLPPAGADQRTLYDIVTGAWAARWPAEDAWVARRSTARDRLVEGHHDS